MKHLYLRLFQGSMLGQSDVYLVRDLLKALPLDEMRLKSYVKKQELPFRRFF